MFQSTQELMDAAAAALPRFAKRTLYPVSGCYIYIGSPDKGGYQRTLVGGDRGQNLYIHRVAWIAKHGPVPRGLQLDHICHNQAMNRGECDGGMDCVHRSCWNVEHLEAVSALENQRRGAHRVRQQCVYGHEFTPANTYTPAGTSRQVCRTCKKLKARARRRAAAATR